MLANEKIHPGFGPFMKRVVKAQLESGGCIYLIEPDDDVPARAHKAQPPDFHHAHGWRPSPVSQPWM
jgi:hypothetical protein